MAREATDSDERLKRIFRARASADIAALVNALQDPEHASVAAQSLYMHASAVRAEREESIRGLRRILKARDPHARAAAAGALGELRAREVVAELVDIAREDPVVWVRAWAVAALGNAGDESSYPMVVAWLEDENYKIRRAAAVALRSIGDPNAVPPLQRAMKRERWFWKAPFRVAIRELEARRAITAKP